MIKTRLWFALIALAAFISISPSIFANDLANIFLKTAGTAVKGAYETATAKSSISAPAQGRLEVAFSPNEGAEQLVLKSINSAQSEIRMLAYSFTSTPVVSALLQARKRGVDIQVVVDFDHNLGTKNKDRNQKPRAALSALKNAGVDVRTVSAFDIMHDKVLIADRKHVQLGSFNYSAAAASRNSENVLVLWDNPDLASIYLQHFARNYRLSKPFETQY